MLSATIYNFDIDLADNDRSVYESLALRVARHPSESEDFLWARVLAYALEFAEGIEFSRGGLSAPEDPPIAVRDLTGAYCSWIEIGSPDAARLHRASKASPRVAVYSHRDSGQWLDRIAGARIHRAQDVELYGFDRSLIEKLVAHLDRRVSLSVSVVDRELYIALEADTMTGRITRYALPT